MLLLLLPSGGRVALAIHACTKPTIAAINGNAIGVGITATLPCAIRIAPKTAKIGFVFSRRGIVLEAASSFFLPRLIGYGRAVHVVTTGSVYAANDPLLDGLFSETVTGGGEEVLARAYAIAGEVAVQTSVVSTALMRQMLWRSGGGSPEAAHLLDSRVLYGLFGGRDNEEGTNSFFEKRDPRFIGTIKEDAVGFWPWWKQVDVVAKPKL